MINDKDRLFDSKGRSFAITHNLKGDSINKWVRQYKENEKLRLRKRIDSVIATHEIISFHRDDGKYISIDKLENIARQYILQRNPKGMYIAVPHFDKNHYHIHICASGIEYMTGKSLRLEKKNLKTLKQNIQKYQMEKYPELSNSIVNHGKYHPKDKALSSEKEYQYKQRTGRATDKEQLTGIINTCYKKAGSKANFFELLKDCDLSPYVRGGKISGVIFHDKKYRLKRLGFNDERLQELDKTLIHNKEIITTRSKEKERIINRRR